MNKEISGVEIRSFSAPSVDMREILRYAGGGDAAFAGECLEEAAGVLTYKVCFAEVPVSVNGDIVDLSFARAHSRSLAKNLDGCNRAVIFAATVGVGIDRLIARYGRLSPSRALYLQAIGSERAEALCDAFEEEIRNEMEARGKGIAPVFRPRFSPGYGDLSLELQRDIFALLDCPRRIGVSLGDSLLMTPSKSVTAIMGIVADDK